MRDLHQPSNFLKEVRWRSSTHQKSLLRQLYLPTAVEWVLHGLITSFCLWGHLWIYNVLNDWCVYWSWLLHLLSWALLSIDIAHIGYMACLLVVYWVDCIAVLAVWSHHHLEILVVQVFICFLTRKLGYVMWTLNELIIYWSIYKTLILGSSRHWVLVMSSINEVDLLIWLGQIIIVYVNWWIIQCVVAVLLKRVLILWE